jgi:asparagine synthase (glutamine-hydrolysing)
MCGIAGYLTTSPSNDLDASLRSMAAAIAHRGPDGEGFFRASFARGQGSVGLAHRRLAIIDLSSGQQPMSSEDGSIQTIFNGEIYNFQKLRDELMSRGHIFKTRSDTETIVHAYEEWGTACVARFRGMFAFALWDTKKEMLFLARDRFGKKPLFVHQRGPTLLFASEIKAILRFPDISAGINRAALWDYFGYRYVPGPATLFQGIRKVEPGHILTWVAGKCSEERYYRPPDRQPATMVATGNVADDFLTMLDESVRIRMASDVPFGAFLSGGIDSSAVVAIMSKYSSTPVNTFSVGFKEARYSELGYAKTIADLFKTNHHELVISQKEMMDGLPDLIRFRDAPVAEPSDIPIYLLSAEARKFVKMVLTGEGADEILGGYPKHAFERYLQPYQHIPGIIRSGLLEPLIRALPYKFHRVQTAIVNLSLSDIRERMPRWFGAFSRRERNELLEIPEPPPERSTPPQFDVDVLNSPLRTILYFDQTSWLPDNLLERGDRMTMAASIEARMPFLDHELAAFVSTLPDEWRVKGRTTKRVLREAMKRLLPQPILNRPKVGFRVPVNEWFSGPMKDYLLDHLSGPACVTRPYYRAAALKRLLEEHVTGRRNHEKALWCMLSLEIWHREYGVNP